MVNMVPLYLIYITQACAVRWSPSLHMYVEKLFIYLDDIRSFTLYAIMNTIPLLGHCTILGQDTA